MPGELVGSTGPLRKRRLLVALALVLALPLGVGIAGASYEPPAPPPTETQIVGKVLPQVPDALARAQFARGGKAAGLARRLDRPQLVAPAELGDAGRAAGPLPTLIVPPRTAPYTLAELRELVPAAFSDLPQGGAVLLGGHLTVGPGAVLMIDTAVPDVRLPSSPAGFATIMSYGAVVVAGTAEHPVQISSWDTEHGSPDTEIADGRAFVVQNGGRMDVDRAHFEYLGFGTGLSSGVAWNGTQVAAPVADDEALAGNQLGGAAREFATGTVTSSYFGHNHFGAYTHEATQMSWVDNVFADNTEYGLDPHTFSSGFVVEGNTAAGNGKHGFIFSRGCRDNVLRANHARDNGGHGFMIDDGRSRTSALGAQRLDDSDGNVIEDNVAEHNAGSGVEIEGGAGNVVRGNRLVENYVGVRVKNGAAVTISDNEIVGSTRYGVDVLDSAPATAVTDNAISGGWGAINLGTRGSAVLTANVSENVSAPLVVAGVAERETSWFDRLARVVRWNPLLVLWSLVLGVPIAVGLLRRFSRPVRPATWRAAGWTYRGLGRP